MLNNHQRFRHVLLLLALDFCFAVSMMFFGQMIDLESETNYVAIFLDGAKKVLVRSNLEDFIQ